MRALDATLPATRRVNAIQQDRDLQGLNSEPSQFRAPSPLASKSSVGHEGSARHNRRLQGPLDQNVPHGPNAAHNWQAWEEYSASKPRLARRYRRPAPWL